MVATGHRTTARVASMKSPIIVIAGETASGKTGAAIATAKRIGGEVVSADSWAVYEGFDIGTAKPDVAERDGVRFHLIDVADPRQGFSAAEFKRLAAQAITDIRSRGHVPIIAGGTGLYIDAVVYDFSFLPAGEAGERERLNGLVLDDLLSLAASRAIDLVDIDTRNKRRVIRAIETNGQRPTHGELLPGVLYLGIRVSLDELKLRIVQRVDQMLAAGLEHEVKKLAGIYGWDVEPMKGIGYREWHKYFDGTFGLPQTRDRIIAATTQLAKRQRTWFKRNNDIQWVDDPNTIPGMATEYLNKTV